MRLAICARKRESKILREMIREYAGAGAAPTVESFTKREDLLYSMKAHRYDAVIVALPGAMGMEAAIGARRFGEESALIWASDETEFIAESYRLRATMFLSLPLVEDEVTEALRRVNE